MVRSHSNISYVLVDGQEITCRQRGKFRLTNQTVVTGDQVVVQLLEDNEGYVVEILPRKSLLRRPAVANVDLALVVFTLAAPAEDRVFLDRLLVQIEAAGLEAVILLNKIDLVTPEQVAAFVDAYQGRVGYPVYPISAREGLGLEPLFDLLRGRVAVLAGQSGVGKSKLVNRLHPARPAQVGQLTGKLERGRHTTRHVELLALPTGGFIVDAPGFTYATFTDVEPEELSRLFPEFGPYSCRYDDCRHRSEPQCGVKEAVAQGEVLSSRYEHYLSFLAELEQQRKW